MAEHSYLLFQCSYLEKRVILSRNNNKTEFQPFINIIVILNAHLDVGYTLIVYYNVIRSHNNKSHQFQLLPKSICIKIISKCIQSSPFLDGAVHLILELDFKMVILNDYNNIVMLRDYNKLVMFSDYKYHIFS